MDFKNRFGAFLAMVAYPGSDAIIIETRAKGKSPRQAGSGRRRQEMSVCFMPFIRESLPRFYF